MLDFGDEFFLDEDKISGKESTLVDDKSSTRSQSQSQSGTGTDKPKPAPPPPFPSLLDLNVDIIDDDGPFSFKSQQQQQQQNSSRPAALPPPNEISDFQPIPSMEGEGTSRGKVVRGRGDMEEDEDDNEDDFVKRLLYTETPPPSPPEKCGGDGDNEPFWDGDGDQQQQQNLLPIDLFQHDKLGLKVTSGSVTITKDGNTNMIGISIGGGAPNCPCLYIVQVFDNTPASKDGTLQSGDEITGVNNVSVKGKTKVEVAKMIQSIKNEVTISYNKLHADAAQGKSLDIILKKVKHRLVENMSSATADALGLSRAILCNDNLVKKLTDLQRTEVMYKGLVEHTQRLLRAYLELLRIIKLFGETFAVIGVREPQPRASLAFTQFADYHRQIEKRGVDMVKKLKPVRKK